MVRVAIPEFFEGDGDFDAIWGLGGVEGYVGDVFIEDDGHGWFLFGGCDGSVVD